MKCLPEDDKLTTLFSLLLIRKVCYDLVFIRWYKRTFVGTVSNICFGALIGNVLVTENVWGVSFWLGSLVCIIVTGIVACSNGKMCSINGCI